MPIIHAWLGVAAAWAAPAAPSDAVAVQLAWDAPHACPTSAHLTHRIARHLGRPVDTTHDRPTANITGTITKPLKPEASWTLELTIRRGKTSGTRTLAADSCAELVDAAAFISAVALDPQGVHRVLSAETDNWNPQVPIPPSLPTPPPKAQPVVVPTRGPREREPSVPPQPRPAQLVRPDRTSWGAVSLGAGVGFGATPRASATLDLTGAWARRRARVEFGVQRGFATRTEIVNEIGGEFSVVVAHAAGCFVPRVRALEFPICGGGRLGAIAGTGIGNRVRSAPRASVWGGVDGQVGIYWALLEFGALFARAHVGVSPATFAFRVNNAGEVFRPSPVYGTLLAGVEARWGPARPAGRIRGWRAKK